MYTYAWYHWITFFYLYCFFGWIFESTYVSFKQHHFVNRGFLRLPMLPLYGSGAILLLWVSLPYQDNLILVYIAGFIAATALEYVTGAVMERLFKVRYWDYSDKKFNINGYICLGSSIAWGFLTIFMTEVIHKPIADFVTSLNPIVVSACHDLVVSGGVLIGTFPGVGGTYGSDCGRNLKRVWKPYWKLSGVKQDTELRAIFLDRILSDRGSGEKL